MDKVDVGYIYRGNHTYIYPIIINRELKINERVAKISELFVEIEPKINSIYEKNLSSSFKEEEDFSCIGDLTIAGELIVEYIEENSCINIMKYNLLEEEYIKLPFKVKEDKIRGKLINKFIYDKGGGEIYVSIYYNLIIYSEV